MNKTLSLQDYELISAYLDSACSTKESAMIEARIRTDAEFRQAVNEFKRAKSMLQYIPQKKAPHNFTLSATQVPQLNKRSGWLSVLNFASAAAALMLVVVFVGNRFFGLGVSQVAVPEAASMMMAAAPSNQAADSTESPMITWGQSGGYGGGGNDTGAYATGKGGGPVTTDMMPAAATREPLVEPTVENPGLTTTSENGDTSSLILGVAPEESRGSELATEAPGYNDADKSSEAPFPWITASEIGLAAIAVGSLLLSLILRRRH